MPLEAEAVATVPLGAPAVVTLPPPVLSVLTRKPVSLPLAGLLAGVEDQAVVKTAALGAGKEGVRVKDAEAATLMLHPPHFRIPGLPPGPRTSWI